jgi:hypothetical protein
MTVHYNQLSQEKNMGIEWIFGETGFPQIKMNDRYVIKSQC